MNVMIKWMFVSVLLFSAAYTILMMTMYSTDWDIRPTLAVASAIRLVSENVDNSTMGTDEADDYFLPVVKTIDKTFTIHSRRITKLKRACSELKKRGRTWTDMTAKNLRNIIVDDRYRLLYCVIPKVACTNLKRVFLVLTGKMNTSDPLDITSDHVHHSKYLQLLDQYSQEEIDYKIKFYKKVIFVREPFERLLSAYRNKFSKSEDVKWRATRKRIIRRYRKNATLEEREIGIDVTFDEFIQYLIDQRTLKQGFNVHWAHYHTLCHPCTIQYNFIGKFETLDEDVNILLKDISVDTFIKFPNRSETYSKSKTKDVMDNYYSEIPSHHLRQLWKLYVDDYTLFGYPRPQALGNLIAGI